MNTKIEYMYRDESNYKESETVVLHGEITDAEKKIIIDNMDDGQFFIPSQVNMDDLQSRMINFPNEDDHVWHELEEDDITLTDDELTIVGMNIHQFATMFKGIVWNVKKAAEEVGLITTGE